MSSSCSLADRRALLSNCCCSLHAFIALFASRPSSIVMCVLVRCTLFAHCSYFAVDSMLLASPFFVFAVGSSLFGLCFLLLSSRVSLFVRLLLADLLHLARYSLFATYGQTIASLFSPCVVRRWLHFLADSSSLLALCYSLLTA